MVLATVLTAPLVSSCQTMIKSEDDVTNRTLDCAKQSLQAAGLETPLDAKYTLLTAQREEIITEQRRKLGETCEEYLTRLEAQGTEVRVKDLTPPTIVTTDGTTKGVAEFVKDIIPAVVAVSVARTQADADKEVARIQGQALVGAAAARRPDTVDIHLQNNAENGNAINVDNGNAIDVNNGNAIDVTTSSNADASAGASAEILDDCAGDGGMNCTTTGQGGMD